MKIRQGFVSNSSSSSFVIKKADLTPEQIDQIVNHSQLAPVLFPFKFSAQDASYSGWGVRESKLEVYGSTMMDNFAMHEYLTAIGVDNNAVEWDSN